MEDGALMTHVLELTESENPARHRLTVSPERVLVKFRKGSSQEEREMVGSFFIEIANRAKNLGKTIRGTLKYPRRDIAMYYGNSAFAAYFEMNKEGKIHV
jgi:hypothetical protein